MKKIDVSAVTSSIGFPVKSGSLTHIQSAYQEAIAELGKAIAGSSYASDKAYILNGCVNGGSGGNYVISAGAVLFNGEVYLVDAAAFATTGSNVAVGVISTTFFAASNADPVEFTDGVLRNVHQIRKIVLQAGLSGSGIANYLDFIDVTRKLQGSIGEIKIWKFTGALATYFTSGLGIHPWTIGWAIADGNNGTEDMGGYLPVGYKASDSDYNTPYTSVGGSKTKTLVQGNLPAVSIDVPIPQAITSFDANGTGLITTGNNGVDTTDGPTLHSALLGSSDPFNVLNPYKTVLYVQRIS